MTGWLPLAKSSGQRDKVSSDGDNLMDMRLLSVLFSGVFVNNYNNFVLWVNQDDQLRLVSVSNGKDLKYALLRLQKAVARIEEALKVFLDAMCGLM